jgi:hypothetical protein
MAKKIPVRVQLDPDLMRWLQREAKERHCSMSQVIRTLIVNVREKGRGA